MKSLICFLLVSICLTFNTAAFSACQTSHILNQAELSPLEILILDIRDAKNLIEEGNNKTAIVILKSANKNIRKVSEFDSETKKITSKRIKKGIALLKQNKNDEALALLQTGIDELIESGLADPSDFE